MTFNSFNNRALSDWCLLNVNSACSLSFFWPGMSLIVLLVFISGVSPKHNMALFLSSHPWMAAFQSLSSSSLLLLFFLSLSLSLSLCLLSPLSPFSLFCHLCNVMFYVLWNLHCSRLNYNLDVADRLADEHTLIGFYVNLLQNHPKTWLVGVWCTSGNYLLCWTFCHLAILPLT